MLTRGAAILTLQVSRQPYQYLATGASGAYALSNMEARRLSSISRRKVIAGAAVAPLTLSSIAQAVPGRRELPRCALPIAPGLGSDPVLARTEAWIAERDAIDAMMGEWQDLEAALCETVKTSAITLTQAYRCGLPEARAMRALDRKIKTGLRCLERKARTIVLIRPMSAEGALAKIRMGLRIQGPYDWEDYAFALAQDGCEQLAIILKQCGASGNAS